MRIYLKSTVAKRAVVILCYQLYNFCMSNAKINQVQRPNIFCWTFALRTSVADVICAGKYNNWGL